MGTAIRPSALRYSARERADLTTVARGSVYYALDSAWDQSQLGSALQVGPLSVVGELDPTGINGVLLEVLSLFASSLDPLLALLEEHRARGSAVGIKFESRRLSSAAAHMGALRLAAACNDITRHFASGEFRLSPASLNPLVDHLIVEIIRVQRKLRQLLNLAAECH